MKQAAFYRAKDELVIKYHHVKEIAFSQPTHTTDRMPFYTII
jgi:hypothetical protein